jgi:NitT/TauT family transport system substrate-binding protein
MLNEDIFTRIFKSNAWGSLETPSGPGSTIEACSGIITKIPFWIDLHSIQTIVDLGCGDFHWMSQVDLENVEYEGYDIVQEAVDAAFVWSPDDKDSVEKVPGSKVLFSTKNAPGIIWDAVLVTDKASSDKRKSIERFLAGLLYANGRINKSTDVRNEAIQNMCSLFNQSDAGFWSNLEIAKFMTLNDNLNFFGMNSSYKGVTGDELYSQMGDAYRPLKMNSGEPLVSGEIPSWREVSDPSYIRALKNHPKLKDQVADVPTKFAAPTTKVVNAEAMTSNTITVNFPTGSSELSIDAKRIIKRDFGNLAKRFSTSYIRIEGNTDNTGSYDVNKRLSLSRANAVKNFLITTYGWDSNRIITVGNGPDKPVSSNDTEEGKAENRRTDFQLVSQ